MASNITEKFYWQKKLKYVHPDIDFIQFDYSDVISTSVCDLYCDDKACVDCPVY